MRIVCPECHAAYQVGTIIKNAILVCHRCNTEFDTYGNRITPENETAQIFTRQEEHAPTFGVKDLLQSGMAGKNTQVWLWMVLILMIIAAAGVIARWDIWQHSSIVRAAVLELDAHSPVLDSDWQINPESVQTQWLKRDDGSLALIIQGEVRNRVAIALPPPEIHITFVTHIGKNISMTLPIIEPADLATLKRVPFVSPPVDTTPVPMLASRGFLLLIENAPQAVQHMLLHAAPTQRTSRAAL